MSENRNVIVSRQIVAKLKEEKLLLAEDISIIEEMLHTGVITQDNWTEYIKKSVLNEEAGARI